MDEVENPDLPAAGESSPTLRPQDDDSDCDTEVYNQHKQNALLMASLPQVDSGNASPMAEPEAQEQLLRSNLPSRPPLARQGSVPLAPQQLPTPTPPNESLETSQDPPDSLTLADLKRIRSTFPNVLEAPPKRELFADEKVYDFEYQDAQSLPVELEEWFNYSETEELKLRRCKEAFNDAWKRTREDNQDWIDAANETRVIFLNDQLDIIRTSGGNNTNSLMVLTYIGLGVWHETAGKESGVPLDESFKNGKKCGSRLAEYGSSSVQLHWIVKMANTMQKCGGMKTIYDGLRAQFDQAFAASAPEPARNESQPKRPDESVGLWCCLTLLYLFIEVARTSKSDDTNTLKQDILALEPNLPNYLTQIVAKLRWDEIAPIPLTKMLLLSWKTILVCFGGIADIDQIKKSMHEEYEEMDARGQPIITASPLDYHLFRQEINSKYPAYQPPAPIFPLEPENNSILPPLKHRRPSYAVSENGFPGAVPSVGTNSIMHQPVHIATPAPSPPPSPAGPGKAGKKQNYQTNQMFPFLYPPLDAGSNAIGGKGKTELQDTLVGRRWEGSDVPTSILEAAELFSTRMRATRGMRQMWDARVKYMEYERGWKVPHDDYDENAYVDDFELVPKPEKEDEFAPQGESIAQTIEGKKLTAVGNYYRDSLPHLQSVVIVLLKAILVNVTDLVTKGNGQNGLQAGIQFNEPSANATANNHPAGKLPTENDPNPTVNGPDFNSTAEELDRLRTQEIAAKALSAILILLLKWFKLSHVLQYEYLTQLLLDSNYVPLVLKLWQAQDIGRACHYRLDRPEADFFAFCQANSRHGAQNNEAIDDEEDEAVPPAIKFRRESSTADSNVLLSPMSSAAAAAEFHHPPEIDELGYPQTSIPDPPLKSYSFRNLFASINYLRVLQKVTRRKTHRALLLVSYKSSNHLKKSLRVPVRELRYYTLKLFKSQVPFCGRKWRQSNMKIITAVWLSVPAELRDDWLSGGGGGMGGACVGDVDGTVEDALPLEQALRSLTHWWNVRYFPEGMGLDGGKEKAVWDEAGGFFERMLEGLELEDDGMAEDLVGMGNEGDVWAGPIEGY
ncbi:Hypothetical protein R9X50_00692600 [Acrodontium crateriforme]|uniref:Factor arrest protein 11 n=1 Tax=Acrodontium crateriforme TaxID=150365 RepID=A0AAQ3MAP3_9PEZI|nr:Hypothetical protein R9X50_00692600 [Acrodontium crateriforme]